MFDLFAYNKQLSGTEINIIKDHGKSSINFPENPVIESLVKTSSSITPYVVTSTINDNETILSDNNEIYSVRNSIKTGISTFIDAHCKDILRVWKWIQLVIYMLVYGMMMMMMMMNPS